jgi:hypothetical protein
MNAAPMLRSSELVGRAITTEVSSGLTCIEDSVNSYAANYLSEVGGSTSTGDMTTSTSSESAGAASTTSAGGGLAMGAFAALVYGAM